MYFKFLLIFLLFTGSMFSQNIEYSTLALEASLTKNANSVVLQEKIEIDVSNPEKVITRQKKAICVLNSKGNNKVNSYEFYDDDKKIKNINLYIYDALGNEIHHIKQREFNDVSAADGFSLYNDDRVLYYDYTPNSYPYTAVFEVETISKSSAFLPKWVPILGYASSSKSSEYLLTFDPLNKPIYKTSNLEGYTISIEETPTQLIAKAKNLPAIAYEEHAPDFIKEAPLISFALKTFKLKGVEASADSWSEFGAWMKKELLEGTNKLPEQTIKEVQALTATCTSNEEKARKIYKYLQDKVRYISIQIGIGGWKPMLASDVDALSYGDCKALTNYTKALLDAVGVPSYYTILYSDSTERDISKDFVAMQGNHAILGVPDNGDIIWLECTSQDLPFGFVPQSNSNRDVLIITEDGGKIVKTTSYDENDSKQETIAEVTVTSSGDILAKIEKTSTGLQYEMVYKLDRLDTEALKKTYKNWWSYINGLKIDQSKIVNDKPSVTFIEKLVLSASSYATPVANDLILNLNFFNRSTYIPPRINKRNNKIEIDLGYTDLDTYTIKVPQGYQVETLPENTFVTSPFGSYKVEYSLVDDEITYKRIQIAKKGVFSASLYEEFRAYQKKIAKLDKTKILLKNQN